MQGDWSDGGATMHRAVDTAGEGSTAVVLLHGIGGGRAIWGADGSDTLRFLAEAGFRAAAPDFPGYGDATGEDPPGLDALVGCVEALVDTLAAPRTVLLGHSMGGMVAQEFAARHPSRVQGLVLVCTSSAFGKPEGDWQAKFVADRLAPLERGLGMAGLARQLVAGMLSPDAPARARSAAEAVMSRVPEATYRSVLKTIVGFDRRADLERIAVPVLCLSGALDRTAPADVMQRMANRLRHGEHVSLQGAGHLAPLEQPAAFHAALLEFLQRHFPVS